MPKKLSKKLPTIIVAILALVVGSCFGVVCGRETVTANDSATSSETSTKSENPKEKTSYIIADANGNTKKTFSLNQSPVDLKLTYFLNGKVISPEEIAGKSGHVTLRFEYKSLTGAPFAVISGTIFDNKKFSNISVDHGKVINDGESTIVAGVAVTNFNKNLPNSVEISADTESFELAVTYTLVSNEIFDLIDDSSLGLIDDLSNQTSDAMTKILDGSSQLKSGLDQLSQKTDLLVNGIYEINGGLKTLSKNSEKLNDGAETIFNKFIGAINSAKNIVDSILEIFDIEIPPEGNLTIENYDEWFENVIRIIKTSEKCNEKICQKLVDFVSLVKSELDQYNLFYQGVLAYTSGVDKVSSGLSEIEKNLPALKQGITDLRLGATALDEGLNKFDTEAIKKITDISSELTNSARNAKSFQKFKVIIKTSAV